MDERWKTPGCDDKGSVYLYIKGAIDADAIEIWLLLSKYIAAVCIYLATIDLPQQGESCYRWDLTTEGLYFAWDNFVRLPMHT